MILDGKVKKGCGCKSLNNTRVPLIIKKLGVSLINCKNLGVPLIISLKFMVFYIKNCIEEFEPGSTNMLIKSDILLRMISCGWSVTL